MKTRNRIKSFTIGTLLGACGIAFAATFNLFSPATGVLKGNASTYVTTAAASTDIRALWSGTCNAASFLRGDGACAAPAASGVTSVALTMPTGFSVGGSPVTSTGTLAVTTTLNGPLRGNGSGLITGNLALASEVSGLLPVANGGIGVGTLTGLVKGNGTSPFSAAASADVISLWSGTCNGTTFLAGDGSCAAAGGGVVGANPTATIGASAVNGAAATFMRSDAAPALPATLPALSGVNLTALNATNLGSGTVPDARLSSNVALQSTGSYSGTLTGCTTTPSITVRYYVTGSVVTIAMGTNVCTSNATSFSMTGAPVAIRPVGNNAAVQTMAGCQNNSVVEYGNCYMTMDTAGTLSFFRNGNATGWTNSGVKGTSGGGFSQNYTYLIANNP